MAWDAYSDNIRAMTFKSGGVFDLSGNPWTTFCDDPNVEFNGNQVPNIIRIMKDGPGCDAQVFIKDMRQQIIRADDSTLIGKKGDQSCIVAIKCNKCILVGAGGDKSEPRQLLNKLSTLAEHVSNSGY